MRRSALRDLFRNLVLATLPMAAAACSRDGLPGPGDAMAPADAACVDDAFIYPDHSCASAGGYVPVSGALPAPAECAAYCPACAQYPFPVSCGIVDSCRQHGVYCSYPVPGRLTDGIAEPPGGAEGAASDDAGQAFARMAWYEAASVPAFRRLARELRALGAPADLVDAARRAAAEEVQHARMMTALARRHGGTASRPAVVTLPLRPLPEVALENAVEGCVRESFSALLAAWQAEAAPDAVTRATLTAIAEDEARHAALAWAVARWAEPRLDEPARARVDAARRATLAALVRGASAGTSDEVARSIGLPVADAARQLARRFAGALLDGTLERATLAA